MMSYLRLAVLTLACSAAPSACAAIRFEGRIDRRRNVDVNDEAIGSQKALAPKLTFDTLVCMTDRQLSS